VQKPLIIETKEPADPKETVHFTVIVRPSSGIGLDELRAKMHVKTWSDCLPDPKTLSDLATELEQHGFYVFRDDMRLHVSARGSVGQFENFFKTELEKHIREVIDSIFPTKGYRQSWFAIKTGAPSPHLDPLPNALAIALPPEPLWLAPRVPPAFAGLQLRLPGDVAQLLFASATHRHTLASGDHATGGGVTAAVIDSGFGNHPYYEDHRYNITRVAADDASNPTVDIAQHGTGVLANLLACAPDVELVAVKKGPLPEKAFEKARNFNPSVISCSFGYPILQTVTTLPSDYIPLQQEIVDAVAANIVVVVAGGNFGLEVFPAMMAETIAVGSGGVDPADLLIVENTSSSYTHPLFPRRSVPDVCGLGMGIIVPMVDAVGNPTWVVQGYTSDATPQVAGVCALLLQKTPTLTPQLIRSVLFETAQDIQNGTSANGVPAGPGSDAATGGGLVDAQKAWGGV
jgi:subtilisin family serine protease